MAMNEFGAGVTLEGDDKLSGPTDDAAESMGGLFNSIFGTSQGMQGFLASSRLMGGGMAGMAGAAGGLAAAMGPIALAIGVVVVAIQAWNDVAQKSNQIMNESIDIYTGYESKLAEVQTILGVTREEMKALGDQSLDYSATYGKSAQDELQGFYQTASAGFADAGQAALIMDTANKLAIGGVTDMNSSVDLLTTVINGYGKSASDALDVSDTLFTTIRAGKTTATELAASFGNVVPSAAAAGASVEESAAAIATLTLAGQSTAEASTALARAFDVLIKKPPGMVKAFEEMGIQEEDLDVRSRGLLPVIQQIGEAFKGNEEELSQAIPQIRAFKAIMPLATTQADKFQNILGQMNEKTGATNQAFNTIANTLQFQKDRWAAMTEGIKTQIGSVFAPAIRVAMDVANELLGIVNKLPEGWKNVIFGMVGVGLAVPTFVNKLGSLVWMFTKFALLAVTIGPLLGAYVPHLIGMAIGLGQQAPILSRLIQLWVAWKDNLDGFRDKVKKVFEDFKLAIRGVGQAIAGGGEISGPLAEELEKAGVIEWVNGLYVLFRRIQVFFSSFWEGFKEAVLAGAEGLKDIAPELQVFIDLLKKGEGIGEWVGDMIPVDAVKEFGKEAGKSLGDVVKWLADLANTWPEMEKGAQGFVDAMISLADSMKDIAELAKVIQPLLEPVLKAAEFLGLTSTAAETGGEVGAAVAGGDIGALNQIAQETAQGSQGTAGNVGLGLLASGVGLVSPAAGLALQGLQGARTINLVLNSKTEVDGKVLAETVQAKQMELDEEGQVQE